MHFTELDICIEDATNRSYEIALRNPSGAELVRDVFPFFDEIHRIAGLLDELHEAGVDQDPKLQAELKLFGFQLFEQIFVTPLGNAMLQRMREAVRGGNGMRLRLRVAPQELDAAPWEFLSNGQNFVALESRTPLSRLPMSCIRRACAGVELPIKVLLLIADPQNVEAAYKLDRRVEREIVLDAWEEFIGEGLIEVAVARHAHPEELQKRLWEQRYHVVFLVAQSAPAAAEPCLMLDSSTGAEHVPVTWLTEALGALQGPRAVVLSVGCTAQRTLNTSFGPLARTLVTHRTQAVLQFPYAFHPDRYKSFLHHLAGHVLSGDDLDVALAHARNAVFEADPTGVSFGLPTLMVNDPACLTPAHEHVDGGDQEP